MNTAAPAETSVEDLLAELPALADTIESAKAAYERRRDVWHELVEVHNVPRDLVADRSRVGVSAVGFALYKRRKSAGG